MVQIAGEEWRKEQILVKKQRLAPKPKSTHSYVRDQINSVTKYNIVSWTMFENIYAISIVVDLYMDLL
jgi:hypothetical protein